MYGDQFYWKSFILLIIFNGRVNARIFICVYTTNVHVYSMYVKTFILKLNFGHRKHFLNKILTHNSQLKKSVFNLTFIFFNFISFRNSNIFRIK